VKAGGAEFPLPLEPEALGRSSAGLEFRHLLRPEPQTTKVRLEAPFANSPLLPCPFEPLAAFAAGPCLT